LGVHVCQVHSLATPMFFVKNIFDLSFRESISKGNVRDEAILLRHYRSDLSDRYGIVFLLWVGLCHVNIKTKWLHTTTN